VPSQRRRRVPSRNGRTDAGGRGEFRPERAYSCLRVVVSRPCRFPRLFAGSCGALLSPTSSPPSLCFPGAASCVGAADLPVAVASPPCLTSRAFTSSIAGSRHCSTCHLFSEPACGAFLVTIGVSFLLGFDVDHFAPFLRVTLLQVVGARPLLLIYLHFFFVPFVSLRRF
jgi:hypothetical protein